MTAELWPVRTKGSVKTDGAALPQAVMIMIAASNATLHARTTGNGPSSVWRGRTKMA